MITNQYLIYMRVQNFLDLLDEDNQEKTLLLSEELSNVLGYKILRYADDGDFGMDQDEDGEPQHMYFFYVKFRRVMKKLQVAKQKSSRYRHAMHTLNLAGKQPTK